MKKADFIKKIAVKTNLPLASVKKVVDAFPEVVKSDVWGKEDPLTLQGFGTFKTKLRKAREGRNPLTGATIQISEKVQKVFKVSASAK